MFHIVFVCIHVYDLHLYDNGVHTDSIYSAVGKQDVPIYSNDHLLTLSASIWSVNEDESVEAELMNISALGIRANTKTVAKVVRDYP